MWSHDAYDNRGRGTYSASYSHLSAMATRNLDPKDITGARSGPKVGNLLKRQRGKSVKGQNFSGLKFQKRYIRVDTEFLYYYVSSRVSVL